MSLPLTVLSGTIAPPQWIEPGRSDRATQPTDDYKHSTTMIDADQVYDPAEHMQNVAALRESSEGKVHVIRSYKTGAYFMRKTLKNKVARYRQTRVSNELQMLQSLTYHIRHRNVVQFFGAGTDITGAQTIYEEYCDGGDLYEQMAYYRQRNGVNRMPTAFICHAFVNIASGLAWMHHGIHHREGFYWSTRHDLSAPFIHADLKPENILLRWTKQSQASGMPDLVITDFGHTKDYVSASYRGTLKYLPPEVQANAFRSTILFNRALLDDQGVYIDDAERHAEIEISMMPDDMITEKADNYCFGLIMRRFLRPGDDVANTHLFPWQAQIDTDFAVPKLVEYVQSCLHPDPLSRLPTMNAHPWYDQESGIQDPWCLLSAIDVVRCYLDQMRLDSQFDIPLTTWYRGPGVTKAIWNAVEASDPTSNMAMHVDVDPNLNIYRLSEVSAVGGGAAAPVASSFSSYSNDEEMYLEHDEDEDAMEF